MKTLQTTPLKKSRRVPGQGFTLLELLVVLAVIAVLIILQLPAFAKGKSQSKIGMCGSNERQLALVCQIYANDNGERLPTGGNWAWDLPAAATDQMLRIGAEKRTFYCPGTAPRFTDKENWAGPGTGANSTLWNFYSPAPLHITGYAFAFSGSVIAATNQNTTILPERITFPSGASFIPPASERVLIADALISTGAVLPGYAHPENNYVSIAGGFQQNGLTYPHVSPHLKGTVPVGGNLGFKDGHVTWRKFEIMTPRTIGGAHFWW